MNTIQILLIDHKNTIKPPLESSLTSIQSASFSVDFIGAKDAEKHLRENARIYDVLLMGEKVPQAAIIRIAKLVKSHGWAGHVILLTRQSEFRISPALQKAGVDDLLNVAEINTPVFGWTFLSTLNYSGAKRKAEDLDVIRDHLLDINDSLTAIASKMSRPVSRMRAAVGSTDGGDKKRELNRAFARNLDEISDRLGELVSVSRRLAREARVITKILAEKAST
jgi:hypothetical protein